MTEELVDVRLVGVPVALHRQTVQHIDELRREFTYISAVSGSVPVRLLELAHRISTEFGGFSEGPRAAIEAAVAAGRESTDLTYRLPPAAGAAATEANAMLDEAEEYCRREAMLAVAAPPEAVAYRRWFFGQIAAQTAGASPCAWPRWRGADRTA